MKRILLFTFTLMLTLAGLAQETKRLSLEEAISVALENNYGQQILKISSKSSVEDVNQAKRDLSPDLNVSLSHGISNKNSSGDYGINASALLWKGGQGINTIRRAKIALSQNDSKVAQAQNDLTINVIRAYLSVLMNEELYNHQSSVVKISEQQMLQGEVKYKSGQILESDYLLLKSQYANDNYSLTNSKINRDNAILELKTLLNIDQNISTETPTDYSLEVLGLPTLQQLIEETLAWLPDLKIASQNVELAGVDTKIAKGGYYPTLSARGSVGTTYNSLGRESWGGQFTDNNINYIGLSLSIPLWDKGRTKSAVKKSEYRYQQMELEAKQTELNIRMSLEKEYSNVISLREKYIASEQNNVAYEETFRVFSTQFEAGSVTTTELLQQQNNYLMALNNFIQSKYSYLLNRKVLDVYMGKEIKI